MDGKEGDSGFRRFGKGSPWNYVRTVIFCPFEVRNLGSLPARGYGTTSKLTASGRRRESMLPGLRILVIANANARARMVMPILRQT